MKTKAWRTNLSDTKWCLPWFIEYMFKQARDFWVLVTFFRRLWSETQISQCTMQQELPEWFKSEQPNVSFILSADMSPGTGTDICEYKSSPSNSSLIAFALIHSMRAGRAPVVRNSSQTVRDSNTHAISVIWISSGSCAVNRSYLAACDG